MSAVTLTGYGILAATTKHPRVAQANRPVPPAGQKFARAVQAGDLAEAARVVRRCPSLRARLDRGALTVSCGFAALASVPAPPKAWEGQHDGRGWALVAANVLEVE